MKGEGGQDEKQELLSVLASIHLGHDPGTVLNAVYQGLLEELGGSSKEHSVKRGWSGLAQAWQKLSHGSSI